MVAATPESLAKFVSFCQQHITGQERKEAQTFLDRFFRAFGHEGALEAGATYEEAIKKSSKQGKTGFADLVWKPRVLIEMKKRGEDLSKHYSQAFDYWTRLVPNRPKYVILCNFDEFWIFDFDIQLDTPVDKIALEQLPERAGALVFMELGQKTPVFQNNQVEVTERAARRMGELLLELEKRGIEKLTAQRFILQCVLAMFAEDRQLLPHDMFVSCVQDCKNGASSYDVLGGLFREMNQLGKTPAGRYQGVDYFNGGLFSQIHAIELTREELNFLDVSAREDWSKVRPAIFGNLFEETVDKKERHARGIHYTSEADIMKIVRPTISRFWEERIEEASTIKELSGLQLELQSYRVLDPACGSGNFLYMAYQELKRIESLLLEKMQQKRKSEDKQMQMGLVTPLQFYGMDTNPFAVELARVTLMIARKIAIDNLNLTEPALPLDTLDNNIVCQDALFSEWVKADAMIGNPPFLGGNRIRLDLGDEYAECIFRKFSEVKSQVDFCVYWFRLAHESLNGKGRAGLVGTNSISQGNSRYASLDYITRNSGYIHEAIPTQNWSGEAQVYVSIVNWCYEKAFKLYLDNQVVTKISSSLSSTVDVSIAIKLNSNLDLCFEGVKPNAKGFIITENQAQEWIKSNFKNAVVIKLFLDAGDLTKVPHGKPSRWVIDFENMSLEEASDYILPFEHVRVTVKPERENNREPVLREKWWRFKRTHTAMRQALISLKTYFTVPAHSKWFIFVPSFSNWLPNNSTKVVASDDFYILGILTSSVHRVWVKAQSSTLGETTRYTHNTCFETFPFPQTPDAKLVQKIRAKSKELHQYRTAQMELQQWGITTLYNKFFHEPTSQLYQLHQQLDKLVMQAYDFHSNDDLLEKLLNLNTELAEKEKQGIKIIGPWSPN
ncbi:class I SAM-dependent DNA methyltransferase [Anabaena cylindrica FACHB-243]|uniref:site-specific DNA-methyltransferase (adenine-specific) n=1 Tax=Anabaena cylindrica (strain ATCC 27899 / PCC 7122) TaxID=272123 RepID=K9ZLX4_ANACC|nr:MULTISPECIES: DNA methyltransferase [Anabaena]AFZ59325.1 DNA modification methyltransferase related protein [Anabaena cylindrica PCC 7122]MBD2416814.1 class I SAM-dependent DNA methyltransferase [Anabaena cylindrica FACHB-243]MBY5280290.1 class I SAM-dependent DNA methyltransferase [Anabaena sp. CCAP 1446/1C]MBY5308274.1 class I SAM-dependent DNA methyltransferase [Anabaena sp. CCAP 1446/1C]MCM2405244.1 N-6 DNA methylase [Anabaena sp. CCAP 1446/1C]